MVLNATLAMKHYHQQELAKKRQSIDNSMIRFPKLDFECAHKISHFHYEYSELVSVDATFVFLPTLSPSLPPSLAIFSVLWWPLKSYCFD